MHTSTTRLATALGLGLLALIACLGGLPAQRTAPTVASHVDIQISIDRVVASGFIHPVQVTHAGDGSGRLFVVEQPGMIRIIKDGVVNPTPFLDLTALTTDSGERGLLGLAFHPDYAVNGLLYVNYTRSSDGATRIERYTATSPGSDTADTSSAIEILTVPQPYANHNGGQLLFGPDGYLYIGMGDGGSGGDPQEHGQNNTTLLGAMLRLDVDGSMPYAIPPGNPYVSTTGRDEIWAIGLRNPWRFSFDRATGDLYIGDVGQNAWEEISFQAAGTPGGVNFGWRCREGSHDYLWDAACASADLTDPIAEYSHTEGRSVSGGFVYRGAAYPNLIGRYFYADYVVGKIWSLALTGTGTIGPDLELETGLNITSFGEDEAGELFVVDRAGSIRTLEDLAGPSNPPDLSSSYKSASTLAADPGEEVTYTIVLTNRGRATDAPVALEDRLPDGLAYVAGSLSATSGAADDSATPLLKWSGPVDALATITVTYRAAPTGVITGSLVNHALIANPQIGTLNLPTALHVPRSALAATLRDLFLPGTQPGALQEGIPPSVDCDTCHSAPIYDAWRGSMMSQAGRDVLLRAAMETANADAGGLGIATAGDYCLRCHTPQGWLEGRSHPADGAALTPVDIGDGVGCALCHRLIDPLPTGGELIERDVQVRSTLTATAPITYVGSATLIVDPADNRRGPFAFSPPLPYHTANRTDFLGQSSEAITRARLCGTCHNVDNPLLSWDEGRQQFWLNAADTPPNLTEEQLFPIESTYREWAHSAYPQGVAAPAFAGAKSDGTVSACQDCHMERQTGSAADAAFNPVERDCETTGCLPDHLMMGGNTWMPVLLQDPAWRLNAAQDAIHLDAAADRARSMLQRAATMTVTLATNGSAKHAIVRVTNETGHKLPTGYPEGRQMWIELRAYSLTGNEVYASGLIDPSTRRLVRDPDIQVYEAKQGLTPEWAAFLAKPAGDSFHFLLNNTVTKDNRIPPRGYTQTAWDRPGLRPVGADYADGQHWDETVYPLPASATRVTARLWYQTASAEYVAFLKATGGVDGEALHDLWTRSPSPPVLMALNADPLHRLWLPIVLRTR